MRKLSDAELDAIEIYTNTQALTVEVIARILQVPAWYIKNIIFKYINGCVKGEYLLNKSLKHPVKSPRSGLNPTPAAVGLALNIVKNLNLKLRKDI